LLVEIGIIQYIVADFLGEGRGTDANIGENLGFHEGKRAVTSTSICNNLSLFCSLKTGIAV
jgi:hypothetical protein